MILHPFGGNFRIPISYLRVATCSIFAYLGNNMDAARPDSPFVIFATTKLGT
jgi:hypothetical protein